MTISSFSKLPPEVLNSITKDFNERVQKFLEGQKQDIAKISKEKAEALFEKIFASTHCSKTYITQESKDLLVNKKKFLQLKKDYEKGIDPLCKDENRLSIFCGFWCSGIVYQIKALNQLLSNPNNWGKQLSILENEFNVLVNFILYLPRYTLVEQTQIFNEYAKKFHAHKAYPSELSKLRIYCFIDLFKSINEKKVLIVPARRVLLSTIVKV